MYECGGCRLISKSQHFQANTVLASQGKAGGKIDVVPEWLLEQCRATIQEQKQSVTVSG